MQCLKPFIKDGAAYGCGRCLPCRSKRRRIWYTRLLLESMLHAENSFVTVTYSEEHLPRMATGATLLIRDSQLWLKRLRRLMGRIVPTWKLRYFLVGEYGSEAWRPHYHAILFGYRGCDYGDSRLGPSGDRKPCRCASCIVLQKSWPLGRVHQGVVEAKSCQYIAGYAVKGLTREDDVRLKGRQPEFARMSLRPGIGADAMSNVADTVRRYGLAENRDAPPAVRIGGKVLPIGRYLRERLRTTLGTTEDDKARSYAEWQAEMQSMREAAAALSDKKVYVEGTYNEEIFRRLLVERDAQKVKTLEWRIANLERGKK